MMTVFLLRHVDVLLNAPFEHAIVLISSMILFFITKSTEAEKDSDFSWRIVKSEQAVDESAAKYILNLFKLIDAVFLGKL